MVAVQRLGRLLTGILPAAPEAAQMGPVRTQHLLGRLFSRIPNHSLCNRWMWQNEKPEGPRQGS